MNKYVFYVKRSLAWSLPVAIAMYITDIVRKRDYGIFDLVVTIIVFVFIAGPIWGIIMLRKNK